jgi:hypothetical protein
MASDIDEKTKIPLFAVISVSGAIIVAAMWISAVSVKADTTSSRVDEMMRILTEVRDRTIRIEQHQIDVDKGN